MSVSALVVEIMSQGSSYSRVRKLKDAVVTCQLYPRKTDDIIGQNLECQIISTKGKDGEMIGVTLVKSNCSLKCSSSSMVKIAVPSISLMDTK